MPFHGNQPIPRIRQYEIRVRENTRWHENLEIALVDRSPSKRRSKTRRSQFKLDGAGQYQRVTIWMPQKLQEDRDVLMELTRALFGTGYRWLEQQMVRIAKTQGDSIGTDLYAFIRTMVSDERLLDAFWLGTRSRNRAFYLLDPTVTQSAVRLLRHTAEPSGCSSIRLATEFIGADIPFDQTFAQVTIGDGHCLDFDMSNARYKDDMDLLARAETGVFGTESISLFPMTRKDDTHLVAVFPTRNKATLEPLLNLHREAIACRFHAGSNRVSTVMRGLLHPLQEHSVARLAGQFFGEFIKVLTSNF